jgi:hypothetical protein
MWQHPNFMHQPDWDSRIAIDVQSGREGGWKILCMGGYINDSLNGVYNSQFVVNKEEKKRGRAKALAHI